MDLLVRPSRLTGSVAIPGSKSHTIRAVAIASLASGRSVIRQPLDSADARAAVRAYTALGATIDSSDDNTWYVEGFGGVPMPSRTGAVLGASPDRPASGASENLRSGLGPIEIDVANSGTSLNISMGSAALIRQGVVHFTGDTQIQRRPAGPIIGALNDLGANVTSERNNGCPPLTVRGTLRGGKTTLEAPNSQYLTSLLINCPLAESDSEIELSLLYERPYVQMTLDWLSYCGIKVEYETFDRFVVPGGQRYALIDRAVPADFSSATFFLAAGAMAGNDVTSTGLDMTDAQGDKAVVDYLKAMGAEVSIEGDHIRVAGDQLVGAEIDLNATPDALPMMAVLACFASGETRLVNCPQARIKETDRIAVMAAELTKMGADIKELQDGLVIRESSLTGCDVEGHDDHRIVMALAVAGTHAKGPTRIHGAEAMNVTFPTFVDCMAALGAEIRTCAENRSSPA